MNIEIITEATALSIYGFSGVALDKDYVGTAFMLSGRMWATVKASKLKNKGRNIWVYQPNDKVFAGVELDDIPESDIGLEQKTISLKKYAYFKHVGSAKLVKQAGTTMRNELKNGGFETELPYIEIYGHSTPDEAKFETELLMTLK